MRNCPEECIIRESSTHLRGASAPPSNISSDPSTHRSLTTTASGKNSFSDKRQASGSTNIISNAKQPHHAPSEDPAVTRAHVVPAGDLTMISELNELDGLDSGLPSNLLPDYWDSELAGEIMSIVTGHSGGAVEFEEEHEEEELSEDFNFNRITATTDEELQSGPEIGSETDDSMHELRQKHLYTTTQCAPAKQALPVKSIGKGKAAPKPASSECYNPDTCGKSHLLYSTCMYILTCFVFTSLQDPVHHSVTPWIKIVRYPLSDIVHHQS
jgi:hypothetical protein